MSPYKRGKTRTFETWTRKEDRECGFRSQKRKAKANKPRRIKPSFMPEEGLYV